MASQLWVEYDELKRLTTQLGCIMLNASDQRSQVKKLCEQMTAKVAAIRVLYAISAVPHVRAKAAPPRLTERKTLKRSLFGF
jgi:hypothetical protein